MNEQKLNEQLNNIDWKYLFIEGSNLGNTSFIFSFLKKVLFLDKTASSFFLDRLIDQEINILYVRSKQISSDQKKIENTISEISKKAYIQTIFSEEIFDYLQLIRTLCNDRYTHLIIDDVRSNYDQCIPIEKFNEIINFCENEKIKLIVSTTHNRQQKMDYFYFSANLIFSVQPYIFQGIYQIEAEDRTKNKISKFLIEMD